MGDTTSGFSQSAMAEGPVPERSGLLAQRRYVEVRFGGTAAQGVIVIGLMLATAATLDHRYVTQTQTHALEETDVHGHCDVIISDDTVDFPELLGADLVVALCQWAADEYSPLLRPDGVLLYDSERVLRPPVFEGAGYALPLGRLARQAAGRSERVPHLVALSVAAAITGVVSQESLLKTVQDLEFTGSKEARKKALSFGFALDVDEWKRRAQ